MSDISASEGSEAVVEAPTDAVEVDFDLDAAMDDFATNAPEEWKGKASKLQSELKNLRSKYAPLRDTFDGLHDGDREAITSLIGAIKSGNTEAAADWMFNAAKGLTGDQFEEKFGITKAEAKELVAEAEEETEPEEELSIEDRIQKALDDRDKQAKDAADYQERQTAINATLTELGLSTERDKTGKLADFRTQMVAQLAVNNGDGDLKAAFETFTKLQGDWAKEHLQKHSGDEALSPGQGSAVSTPEEGTEDMTPAQRAKARLMRVANGPAA